MRRHRIIFVVLSLSLSLDANVTDTSESVSTFPTQDFSRSFTLTQFCFSFRMHFNRRKVMDDVTNMFVDCSFICILSKEKRVYFLYILNNDVQVMFDVPILLTTYGCTIIAIQRRNEQSTHGLSTHCFLKILLDVVRHSSLGVISHYCCF